MERRARTNTQRSEFRQMLLAWYREHILGEKPQENFVSLDSLKGIAPAKPKAEEPVMGD